LTKVIQESNRGLEGAGTGRLEGVTSLVFVVFGLRPEEKNVPHASQFPAGRLQLEEWNLS
jgi:hypothetical protein